MVFELFIDEVTVKIVNNYRKHIFTVHYVKKMFYNTKKMKNCW